MIEHSPVYALYCLVPSAAPLRLPDAGVLQCPAGNISALLSEVGEDEYCGPAAEERMKDLEWLGPRACRHEAVIEHIMERLPVLPAPLATLFTSLDTVRRFVDYHRPAITSFFEGLGNCREWAVKGFSNSGAVAGGQPAGGSSGRQYLLERRGRDQARQRQGERLRQVCQGAAGGLETLASRFCARRVWNLGPESASVRLNWAFLLSPAQEDGFRARVQDLNARHGAEGLGFALSGPWPPYSFAPVLGELPR